MWLVYRLRLIFRIHLHGFGRAVAFGRLRGLFFPTQGLLELANTLSESLGEVRYSGPAEEHQHHDGDNDYFLGADIGKKCW